MIAFGTIEIESSDSGDYTAYVLAKNERRNFSLSVAGVRGDTPEKALEAMQETLRKENVILLPQEEEVSGIYEGGYASSPDPVE